MNITLYLTVFLLWIGHFFVDVMIGIWPVYKTMAHLDLATAGLIAAGCTFAGEGMQIVFGSLSDRGYRKSLIVLGLFIVGGTAFMAYTDNYLLIAFLFLCTCLGSGAFHPCAASLMSHLSSERKGLFITLFATGGSLGLGLSQLLFYYAHHNFDGHTSLLALPAIGIALFIALGAITNPPTTSSTGHKWIDFKTLKAFFKRHDLRTLYISQVCNQTMLWAFVFLLPDVLISREYDTWISLGGGHLFLITGCTVMLIPGGYLADKYSSRLVIIVATIIGILFLYLFLCLPMLSPPFLLGLLFVFGASIGVVNPISVALGNRLAPDNPGLVSAFLMGLVWCISEGFGQGVGGLLTKLFVDEAPAKALGIMGLALFVGLAMAVRLPVEVRNDQIHETLPL